MIGSFCFLGLSHLLMDRQQGSPIPSFPVDHLRLSRMCSLVDCFRFSRLLDIVPVGSFQSTHTLGYYDPLMNPSYDPRP